MWEIPSPLKAIQQAKNGKGIEELHESESFHDAADVEDDVQFLQMEEGVLHSYFDPPKDAGKDGVVRVSDLIPRSDFISLNEINDNGDNDDMGTASVLRPVYHHLRHRFRSHTGSRWYARSKGVGEYLREERCVREKTINGRAGQ